MHGQLYIITAPSGAGKSTILSSLLSNPNIKQNIAFSISHTTRKPREGEVDGREYYFVSKDKFEELIDQNRFIEYARVFDNYYGTSFQAIHKLLENGIDVFLDIDWQGSEQIKIKMPGALSIFIMPPSLKTLHERLNCRGTDAVEVIEKRLNQARGDVQHASNFDYVIVNDNLEKASALISHIIIANRLRTVQRTTEIHALINEF